MENEPISGMSLKYMLYSEQSCLNFSNFMHRIHGYNTFVLTHTVGYRQAVFVDYLNTWKQGYSSVIEHTSPIKQYYLLLATSFEQWLEKHVHKLKNH